VIETTHKFSEFIANPVTIY